MTGKLFGYARVSTDAQSLERQLDILKEFGVLEADVFTDKISGTKLHRPQLDQLQRILRAGDTVIVESLSRLSRSTKDLLAILEDWQVRNIAFISIKERLDFSTATGKLILTVLAAIAAFERDITYTRVREGLASARARGRVGGRKPMDKKKLEQALKLYDAKSLTLSEIREATGVSASVIYRALWKRRDRDASKENPHNG
ncbi:recombinase family protein [Cohnella yongneupensis]|uniref:Recombinase family protein n=1 Tax=Cohnella yongneupensis TaxID=425006 RepID=A0ABW0R213_9BACL